MTDETESWRNAALLLAIAVLATLALQQIGLQFTPLFLFFSIYFPFAFASAVYVVKYLQKRRRAY
ncbi:MAG: hypothetical protein QXR26_02100 [Candidatus Caldarchaeum sp.]